MTSTYNISMVDKPTLPLDTLAFTTFLVEAKKSAKPQTAADGAPEAAPGAIQLVYSKGLYSYTNIYYGTERFSGQETVHYDSKPIWGMGYSGGLITHYMWDLQPQWVYAVLRAALAQVTEELPFRGPLKYEYYGFEYNNHPLGHLAEFLGEETIKYRDSQVYHLWYVGGFIK
ncbi:MAG TPA: DUF5680 domain-containing protein [Chloroflexia bacterium]|nr:DUF5680 domain-containing protein [Chloroflexia bacterium]